MSPTFEYIKKAISTLPAAERLSLWRELAAEFGPAVAEDQAVILAIGHAKRRPFYFRRRIGEARKMF